MANFLNRLQHAWSAFLNKDPTVPIADNGTYYRPDRPRFTRGNERSIVNSVYNRISMDCAAIEIHHSRIDDEGQFVNVIESGLNTCLTLEANIDQTGRAFVQDIVMSMLDEGCVAVVPVETSVSPNKTSSYDILSMRTGKIIEWYPEHVLVRLYNERTGNKEEVKLPKKIVGIIENPLYSVINEPNSTLQRLIRKLNLLDYVDEQSSSGKLDLIIQLPYTIKSVSRREQAEIRRQDIVRQLSSDSGSKYGIAYTDASEKITQLNRSLDNNLIKQVEDLTSMLYSQLGITTSILDGTADEKTMLNYYNRTIEPIVSAITDELKRKFLTKTARTQLQSITFFRDPFKLVPLSEIANMTDSFVRNEVLTSNEIRQIIGRKPSDDPRADQLLNSNINPNPEAEEQIQNDEEMFEEDSDMTDEDLANQTEVLDNFDSELDDLEAQLNHSDDSDFLAHYASPYYDPVKAHEYYMQHRKLKGRRSTSGLNQTGKEAAAYVKKNLDDEYKKKVESSKNTRDNAITGHRNTGKTNRENANASAKRQREQASMRRKENVARYNAEMKANITSLKNKLKAYNSTSGLSAEQKARYKEEISNQIAVLRNNNKMARDSISQAYRTTSSKITTDRQNQLKSIRKSTMKDINSRRDEHKSRVEQYRKNRDDTYEKELEKIKSEKQYLK